MSTSLRAIYGARFLANLEKFTAKLHDTRNVEVSGYVSKNIPEACKANGAQQAAFLNGRPVDLPKLVRIMNESYRALNPTNTRNSATPIFFLNFTIPMDMVDINMSPDKRTVIFVDQDSIFKMLQSALCLQLDPQAERTFALQVLPPMRASKSAPEPEPGSSATQLHQMLSMDAENTASAAGPISTDGDASQVIGSTPPTRADLVATTQSNTLKNVVDMDEEFTTIVGDAPRASSAQPFHPSSSAAFGATMDIDIEFESQKPSKTTASQRNTEDAGNDLEVFEPPRKKSAPNPGSDDAPIDIDQPSSLLTPKKSAVESALERYNRPAVSPVSTRDSLISKLDAFSSASNQPLSSIGSILSQPNERNAARSLSPVTAPVSAAPSRPSSVSPQVQTDDVIHHGCHDCHESHEEQSSMQIDDVPSADVVPAPAAPRVEFDAPRANSAGIMTASQALGQVSTKLPFSFKSFAARYRARNARLAKQEVQNRELRDQLKSLGGADWSRPHKVGNRTVRRFSPISPTGTGKVVAEKKARTEMTKQVSKADFASMIVIGQFNTSFIICKLDEELFILDQHACDEKYNFEQLCKEKNVKIQPLIVPLKLELQPPDMAIIVENLDEFLSRGFLIESSDVFSPSRAPQASTSSEERLTIVDDNEEHASEVSDNSNNNASSPAFTRSRSSGVFKVKREDGVEDWRDDSPNHRLQLVGHVLNQSKLSPEAQIHEIIEAIRDGLQDMKLESEYKRHATTACRMSVMFGKPLPVRKMREIVSNMSTMNQPWNCPHGRPTMRHLMTLGPVTKRR